LTRSPTRLPTRSITPFLLAPFLCIYRGSRATFRLAIKQASQAGKPWLAGLKLFIPEAGLLGLIG